MAALARVRVRAELGHVAAARREMQALESPPTWAATAGSQRVTMAGFRRWIRAVRVKAALVAADALRAAKEVCRRSMVAMWG